MMMDAGSDSQCEKRFRHFCAPCGVRRKPVGTSFMPLDLFSYI